MCRSSRESSRFRQIQTVQGTHTSESLGTSPVRHVQLAEVPLGPPLTAEPAPPMLVTAPVVDVLPVVVEYVQPAPVIDYVVPAPAVTCAELAPVVENIAPAPIVMQDVEKTIELPSVAVLAQVAILLKVTLSQYQTWSSPACIFVTSSCSPSLFSLMPAQRLSQQTTQQASFLGSQSLDNPVDVVVPKDAFDATIDTQPSPISNTGSPCSGSADIAMCPPVCHA